MRREGERGRRGRRRGGRSDVYKKLGREEEISNDRPWTGDSLFKYLAYLGRGQTRCQHSACTPSIKDDAMRADTADAGVSVGRGRCNASVLAYGCICNSMRYGT